MENRIIVTETTAEIKVLAKSALSGFWLKMCLGNLIVQFIVSVIPGMVSRFIPGMVISYTYNMAGEIFELEYTPLSWIFSLFLSGPFSLGLIFMYFKLIRTREGDYRIVFTGFQHYAKAFLLTVLMVSAAIAITIPVSVVTGILLGMGVSFPGIIGRLLFIFGILAGFCGSALIFFVTVRMSMSNMVLADRNLKPTSCIKESFSLTKGNWGRLVWLYFSFLGWGFVAMFLSGMITMSLEGLLPDNGFSRVLINFLGLIPLLPLNAYIFTSQAFFYELATGHLIKTPDNPLSKRDFFPVEDM